MPWKAPDIDELDAQITEARMRAEFLREQERSRIQSWTPRLTLPSIENIPPLTPNVPDTSLAMPEFPGVQAPDMWQAPVFDAPELPEAVDYLPAPITPALPRAPAQMTPTAEKPSPVSNIVEVDKAVASDTPLWLKTVNLLTLPIKLVQDYVFNPALSAIHIPFTRKLTADEERQARREGIRSYFPGGVRNQAYEDLKYPGKWAVEILPWLIVPPIGTVGAVGATGRGIAGALGALGKGGRVAGRLFEYSPSGLAEKAVGGVVGAITGKAAKAVKPVPTSGNPLIDKLVGYVSEAKTIIPEQKALTRELRRSQLKSAMSALERNGAGEEGLRAFNASFKGKAGQADFEAIASKLSSAERDTLSTMILDFSKIKGNVFMGRQASEGWKKMLNGELPVDSELDAMQKVFGPQLVQALLNKKPGNALNKISDVVNAPRAVLSSFDLSALLRQGAILTARHPVESIKTVRPMIKSFFSDKNASLVEDVIKSRTNTAIGVENGLYLAPLPSSNLTTPLSKLEESFMSKWVETVPLLGSMVKASNRAYVTGLNDLRSRVWESTVTSWQKMGVKANPDDFSQLAKLINAASGRGSLPKALQGASPVFNAMFFSPRLFLSRLQFPTMLASSSPLVRKEAAKQVVSFLGAGTAILSMAKVMGAGVEMDPRSADFGKIKIGNTRLDIWAGYAQWSRFLAQLATEQRKTSGGNIREVNRREVIDRFLQSKFAPGTGLINDLLRGEGYSGESMDFSEQGAKRLAWSRLAPLFIQDLIDAIDQEGPVGGLIASPGLFGVGVVTYMSPAQKMKEQLAQSKYGISWEELGRDPRYGVATQLELERSDGKLLAEIQKEREEYNQSIAGKSDLNNIYRNQTETIEAVYRSKVNIAVQEYRDTGNGYDFKEKVLEAARNRGSQYDLLNQDPQFADIVARYNELPSASDLKKMSPQDAARKEYMRLMYSEDMYDQYGNYRFDMLDDVKDLFVSTYGNTMLDYIETYQGVKDNDMPPEYLEWKQAQKALKPYWAIADKVTEMFGKSFAESSRGQSFISKQRKALRLTNPEINRYYLMFYAQS